MVYSEAECACVKPISFSVAAPECPDKRAAPGGYEQLVHGSWLPMPCPGGLVFNANTCVCDWPQADNQVEQVALDYTGDTPSCTLLPAPGKPAHYQEMIHGVLMTRPCAPERPLTPSCAAATRTPAPGLPPVSTPRASPLCASLSRAVSSVTSRTTGSGSTTPAWRCRRAWACLTAPRASPSPRWPTWTWATRCAS